MVLLAATVITGMVVCGGKHHDGLLADVVSAQAAESLEDVHNVLANVTLAFVLAHIATVSWVARLARPTSCGMPMLSVLIAVFRHMAKDVCSPHDDWRR